MISWTCSMGGQAATNERKLSRQEWLLAIVRHDNKAKQHTATHKSHTRLSLWLLGCHDAAQSAGGRDDLRLVARQAACERVTGRGG
jgi:hypothetical protein